MGRIKYESKCWLIGYEKIQRGKQTERGLFTSF